jgi:GNAT superfamily N-acetyltransferase
MRMDKTVNTSFGRYTLSDDPGRLELEAVHEYLERSYWAESIPFHILERAVSASLCLGAYDVSGRQVGFARLISDYATFCYVCDVYVLEDHRGRGLSKALMAMAKAHPRLQGLRRWHLVTRDAHGLYELFGFRPLAHQDRHMEITDPYIYKPSGDNQK